ncbi:MAG: glucose-6-phosphate dehydrogenase [Verrucomicrobia bacterium]|nr:MAG: glucose-6-phosphate dehydrogenase [Verrucomicrobiota bacterium]
MEQVDQLDELLVCRLDLRRRKVEPSSIVIFGASGDLTARKLIPAFYHLFCEGQLPTPFRIIGFARREMSDSGWRDELKKALDQFSRTKPVDEAKWAEFAPRLFYCQGDMSDAAAYVKLGQQITTGDGELKNNLLFYLAISPSQFAEAVERLHNAKLLRKEEQAGRWQRLVVEKPFGHDLASARKLNAELTRFAYEKQIYRIDHYLGKETVQNILMFRFSNAIFEQLWNRQAIEVLSLVTMEPPVSLETESVRDEKVKLLKSVRPLDPSQITSQVVRGQYAAGQIDGQPRPAYRQEAKVRPDSNVETYVALKLFIDNWRWSGVPFYLRTGKSLPLSASEVRVQFRQTPHVLFAAQCGPRLDANAITLRLQPNEGITLRFNGKVPGTSMEIRPVRMHFSYDAEFGAYTPEAYERLLLEALAGDATLFIRRDEVEAAWSIVDPIRQAWDDRSLTEREFYAAGTWGPAAADDLLAPRNHTWRNPQPRT